MVINRRTIRITPLKKTQLGEKGEIGGGGGGGRLRDEIGRRGGLKYKRGGGGGEGSLRDVV